MVKLQRFMGNPILAPTKNPWEDKLVFNPAAIVYKEKIQLLYRAMGYNDNISRIGIATSDDGIHFSRSDLPLYDGSNNPLATLGAEDMRAVRIDDIYYLTYTAVSARPGGKSNPNWKDTLDRKPQVALVTTTDFISFHEHGVIIPHAEGKDASLLPEKINGSYVLFYREGPEKTFFATSTRLDSWNEKQFLFDKRSGFWDSDRAGIGAPPIKTDKGWLLFYHGIDKKGVYRLGIMFLDSNNPTKILYRSREPVFEPEAPYEITGFTPDVVFTCGAIEKDDAYYVYYGAADHVVGLATVAKNDILSLF